jgi:hypothetical protein
MKSASVNQPKRKSSQVQQKKPLPIIKAEASAQKTVGLEEIDSLFASIKQKKEKVEVTGTTEDDEMPIKKSKTKEIIAPTFTKIRKEERKEIEMNNLPHGIVKSNNPRQIISPEAPVERIDPESGYKVYKAHTLKVGEGGGTDLCPFDCDCCF